jgi:uncharacterized protein DUF1214
MAAFIDSKGNVLDGGKTYKLHLPPNIPVKNFWAVIVYDNRRGRCSRRDQQYPSVSSQPKGLKVNADRRSRARAGTSCCVFMDRFSPGLTRLGGPGRSNSSHDIANTHRL